MKGKKYPFSAYDKYLNLRISPLMWMAILFLARPFVILIISITNRRDRMGILQMFNGDPALSFLGALAAIPVMLVVVAWIRRKPDASPLVRRIWTNGRSLLILASILNIAIMILPALTGSFSAINAAGGAETVVCILIIFYLARSERVKDTFGDFPKSSASD